MQETAGDYVVATPGGLPLAIAGFARTDYRVGLGALLEYEIVLDNGLMLTPQLGVTLAGSKGDAAVTDLFGQAHGQFSAGLLLRRDSWRLGGRLDLDLSTSGARALSAKGTLAAGF